MPDPLDPVGAYADARCAATAYLAREVPDGCNTCGRTVQACWDTGCDTGIPGRVQAAAPRSPDEPAED